MDELDVAVGVVAVEVAAMTHGDASRAAVMAIAATAVSCAVLVFIFPSVFGSPPRIYWISEMVPESPPNPPKKSPRLGLRLTASRASENP